MPGNLNIIDESGAKVQATQPADQKKLVKRFDKEDALKLLGLLNEDLNDVEKKWTVKRQEDGQSVEIYCDAFGERECKSSVDKLQEHILNLKYDVIDCQIQQKSREEILRILKKQVRIVCIPSESHKNKLRIYAKNKEDLDQAKAKLSGSSDGADFPPNSRQNRSLTSPSYDYPDPTTERAARRPSSRQNRSFTSPSYDYPDLSPDRASGGSTVSPSDIKFQFQTSNGLTVKIYKGAITKLNVDAVVNAANEHLANGAGVAGALSKAGGYEFDRECRDLIRRDGNIPVTKNVVTGAGRMGYKGVIHAVGPQWYNFNDKTECVEKVRDTVVEILETSERTRYRRVAMPPISSGLFGVPTDLCAAMYVLGILDFSESSSSLRYLTEFHIIDIKDEILDMVIDYYDKWKKNPSALDPYKLVSGHPKVTKGDSYNKEWRGHHGSQGHRHNQGHRGNQGQGAHGNQGYSHDHSSDKYYHDLEDKKEWNKKQGHQHGQGHNQSRFRNQGQDPDHSKMQDRGNPYHKPCTIENNTFVFRGMLKVHIYAGDIIQSQVDAIVATDGKENKGAISKAIEEANGSSFTDSLKKLKEYFFGKGLATGQVFMAKPHNMKHLRCIYYIIMERFSSSVPPSASQLKELKRVVLEVLGQANRLQPMKKKGRNKNAEYKPLTRMAMSIPGAGSLDTPLYVEKCSEVMFAAFDEFTRKTKQMQLQEIHVVDMREDIIVKGMQQTFEKIVRSYEQRSLPSPPRHSNKKDEFPSGRYENHADIGPLRKQGPKFWPEKCKKIDEWRSDKNSASGRLDVSKFFTKLTKPVTGNVRIIGGDSGTSGVSGSAREGATCGDQVEDSCVICMDTFDNPVKLNRCGHMFCRDCISESFHQKPVCPVCTTVYAVVQGDQPLNGTATVYRDDASLPGYSSCKTLIINYVFSDGIQDEEHPDPGQRFKGLNRQGYLPENQKGRNVLQMLKEAFEQRLTFTVGQSRTTGENNVVTWNDIHHKTRRDGGSEKFGYPDNEYLDRVTEELNAKGIGL